MEDIFLKISIIQYDISWEDKSANLSYIENIVDQLAGKTDIVVLPEMFSTGFSMKSDQLAEPISGNTVTILQKWASKYDLAICGSFIAEEAGKYYNRGFFITANNSHFYDKKHLFRMGNEKDCFSAGNKKLIFEHKGFNICLLICYDLRFPVWARNVDNCYDLLIYTANWPSSRINIWNTLLAARAIENMSFVCGVNRIGIDGNGLEYNGYSKLINARGEEMSSIRESEEVVQTITISKKELNDFRIKFPVWKDADKFKLD